MYNIFRIDQKELHHLLYENIKLIDVRPPEAFNKRHIPQAQNIPLEKIKDYNGDPKEPVYIICQTGIRSWKAAQILNNEGYQTYDILGGMNEWKGRTTSNQNKK